MANISVDNTSGYNDLLKAREAKQLEKIGRDFESHFITSMLKEMDKTTRLTKKSYREETTMSIMYEKLGDYLAKKGVGIKEMLMKYGARTENTKVSAELRDNKE